MAEAEAEAEKLYNDTEEEESAKGEIDCLLVKFRKDKQNKESTSTLTSKTTATFTKNLYTQCIPNDGTIPMGIQQEDSQSLFSA